MNRHLDHNNAQPIHDEGCHPASTQNAQVALALREVCDLSTKEIARAFLTTPPTPGATHRARQEQDERRSHFNLQQPARPARRRRRYERKHS
jgi:RNA polymerase sigma-70 factor (ECF subfamily)